MKRVLIFACAIVLIFFWISGDASATLIGDQVTLTHWAGPNPLNQSTFTVEQGDVDLWLRANTYSANVEADSIYIDFLLNYSYGTYYSFNGFEASDLDYGPGYILSGVSIDTNMSGWNDSLLFFDDDSVSFNWTGQRITSDTYFDVTLTFTQTAPVPEPSTIVLFSSGLIGLVGLRRKLRGKFKKMEIS